MCHHQHRALLAQQGDRVLHRALRRVVQRRGGFIEQQNRRVFDKSPRNRNPLALAAGELAAVDAHARLQALGQGLDEFQGVGAGGSLRDLRCRRIRTPVGDIGRHRVVKQHHVLPNPAQLGAQGDQIHLRDVLAIEQDAALGRFKKARHQLHDGGFAAAGRAHQSQGFAGTQLQAEVLYRPGLLTGVAKTHAFKAHMPARPWRRAGGSAGRFGWGIEQLK